MSLRVEKEEEVLILGEDVKGRLFGVSKIQAPEIDGITYVEPFKKRILPGELVKVKIKKSGVYDLWGKALD